MRVADLRVFPRFLLDRAGNIATMTALMAPAGLILAAIAIDFGSLYTQRRELQSFADLAAITAAANLGNAEAAVAVTLRDNGVPAVRFERPGQVMAPTGDDEAVALITPGRYVADPATAANKRFVAGRTPYNAVRVKLKTMGDQFFSGSLISAPLVSAEGVARVSSTAAFSVGSRLLSLNGGLVNTILGGLLGGSVSLSVMDYNALLGADVQLFDFFDVLATKLHVTAGTYNELLATEATVGQVAAALADVPGLDRRSQLALKALGLSADGNLKLPLGKLFDLGEAGYLSLGGRPAALSAAANVLQILTASAAVANGKHQVALNLGAAVPGILSATLDLAIGEPPQHSPWFAMGEVGTIVRTAQTRLLLKVQVGGPGGLLGNVVDLPIYIELAYAEAKLANISCAGRNPATTKVAILAQPGVAELRIADIDAPSLARFDRSPVLGKATLVKVPLVVTVTGSALVTITNNAPSRLDFTRADIDGGVVKTVSTRDLTQTLTASLLRNLDLTVKLAGLDLGGLSGTLKTALLLTLTNVTPAVDQLVMGVLDTLGIRVGEADVRVHGANCGRAALVQ